MMPYMLNAKYDALPMLDAIFADARYADAIHAHAIHADARHAHATYVKQDNTNAHARVVCTVQEIIYFDLIDAASSVPWR